MYALSTEDIVSTEISSTVRTDHTFSILILPTVSAFSKILQWIRITYS